MKKLVIVAASILPVRLLAQDPDVVAPPSKVEEIRCAGNAHTSCTFIRDHLYLRAGDALDEEEIRNAELRLSAVRNFESAHIRLLKGAERGAVIVVVEVEEANPVAKEWIGGASSRLDSTRGVVGGRVAFQNLFGTGKYADLSALVVLPAGGSGNAESYDVALRYADPHLFNSRRWFGVASAGFRKSDYADGYGNYSHAEYAQIGVTVGVRIGDFSYLLWGQSYRPNLDWQFGRWKSDGSFRVSSPPDYEMNTNLVYGWSTEDDLHFPTRGSTFQLAAGPDYGSKSPNSRSHVQLRKTWEVSNAFWTLKIGGDPSPEFRNSFGETQLLALNYARPIAGGDEVRRGRWYIEPGVGPAGLAPEGKTIYEAGLKVGIRADTRSFGIIDLYLIGSVDSAR